MNVRPTQVKDKAGNVVDAQEAVCEVCDGNSFHIVIIQGHNHLICSNPVCGESFCQGGCSEATTCKKCGTDLNPDGKCQDETCPHSDHPQENCSYCGSGLMKDGECQKCGL